MKEDTQEGLKKMGTLYENNCYIILMLESSKVKKRMFHTNIYIYI